MLFQRTSAIDAGSSVSALRDWTSYDLEKSPDAVKALVDSYLARDRQAEVTMRARSIKALVSTWAPARSVQCQGLRQVAEDRGHAAQMPGLGVG